ncbi:hypothetical protein CK503_00725 [Aliifodinibius salipaludis]|uniref:SusE outer membrane protein domain-containing protein n=1 Tax=Fodinibius salipaludis TaxID=2032627 RepID=A0A2A2GEI0_9BACT|nr:SusE domain-containing protein [Aliifodinibius salipaludis]PAU95620.1 hypothetical protein CK503_00725 [Aliifodinibius salipaludis]
MKNLTIILSILGLFTFVSCDKGELGPVANTTDPGSPSITAPESGQSYTLLEDNAADTLMTMEWTAPDYGVSTVTTYAIQLDTTQGGNFANPMQLATTNQTSWSITVQNMNITLLGANLPADQETSLDLRVVATIADSVEEQVSEPISLGFTPYSLCQFCPAIYVPGGYQSGSGYGSDWTPGDAPALGSVSGGDIYEGYVYFSSGAGFKLTGTNTGWDSNWGTPDNSGTLEFDGGNISIGQAGYYQIYADIPNLSYSLVRTEWGIIGTATADDWNSDQDMTFDSSSKTWSITTDLTSGALKFRANDAWDINYGPANADALQGDLIQTDGAINIPEAGNYTIEIDLNGTNYTYTVTQN